MFQTTNQMKFGFVHFLISESDGFKPKGHPCFDHLKEGKKTSGVSWSIVDRRRKSFKAMFRSKKTKGLSYPSKVGHDLCMNFQMLRTCQSIC